MTTVDNHSSNMYTRKQVEEAVRVAIAQLSLTPHLDNEISQSDSPSVNCETLTVSQAAELIGISKPKMYELIRTNAFRSINIGHKILVSRQSLLNWIRGGTQDGKETR